MPYKDKPIVKKYYNIGEVADMFGVATSLLRFWEKEFDEVNPKKNRNGKRQYTQKDIDNIKLIYHLVKEKGYTLSGAREIIKTKSNKSKQKLDVISSLTEVRNFLQELRSDLS
jgi:DNA-binding transcriptional MerR regulator